MRRFFLSVLLVISAGLISAQDKTVTYLYDPGAVPEEKVIDISHLTAHISIDPYDTLVKGSVVFTFSPVLNKLDSMIFWAPDMEFSSAEIAGVSIDYKKRGDQFIIINSSASVFSNQTKYEVRMDYTSKPKYDLFFIGWNEPALRSNKQIWAHRPFHWLPYYSDRLTVDMFITFDDDYQVFTNGVRESVKNNPDGTKTWHYKMHKEHPFFSTCLVIGDYKYLQWETRDGVPLELCYYSGQEDHAEPTYRYTREMFDFFKDEFGVPYPYELYREEPVADYLYGAMETTTATVFGDYLAVDERGWDLRNYVNVNAHELAHQWYGDCISHLRPADVWLTESFATYFAKKFEEHIFGDDYYQDVRRQEFDEVLAASPKDGFPVGHSRGGRARWYPKGSLVLDMMRDVLGEEGFKASIKHYTEKNLFSEAETSEFLSAIYEATGQSLNWFFDEWIYRGGEPKYEVTWYADKSQDGTDQIIITVKQVHTINDLTGLFKMPVDFEVYYEDGSKDHVKAWIEDEYEEVAITNPMHKSVSFVLFDPGKKILKTVVFEKTTKEFAAQALRAEHMIDRYDALVALRNYPMEIKKSTLLKAWENESFYLTKAEILKQLIKDYSPEFDDVLIVALKDDDPLVRRAVLEYTAFIPLQLQTGYEALLKDKSYVNVEKALSLLSRSFPQKVPVYLEATKHETGWRGLNIRMKWLEIAIGAGQREYLKELVDYTGPRFEFETRINAFQVLKRLNYLDEAAAHNLIDGYLYWNNKVSNAAKDVISYFYQQNRGRNIFDELMLKGQWTKDQRKKVENMISTLSK